MTRLRWLAPAVAVPVAVASLAACGSSKSPSGSAATSDFAKSSATTIDQQGRDALASLSSVHLVGTVKNTASTTAIDLRVSTLGTCLGSVTVGGQTLSIVGVGNKYFMKTSRATWAAQVGAKAAAKIGNRWVFGLSSAQFESFCNLKALVQGITKTPVADEKPTVVGTSTVNGIPVVELKVTDPTGSGTLSIAMKSPHYLLKAVSSDGNEMQELSDFNVPFTVTAPQGAVNIKSVLR